jgi:hydroxymethylpyrimidine/phosphomethylpyrimidine kinase
MKVALTIAGSDPISGAGVQADLKTFAANGVYGTTVITAITAQNTKEVKDVLSLPEYIVEAQFIAVAEEFQIDAVKIGMVYDEKTIGLISSFISKYGLKNVVLDPVIISSTNRWLVTKSGLSALKRDLIEKCFLLTPNKYEIETLLDTRLTDIEDIYSQKEKLKSLGVKNILIKGGHFNNGDIKDILWSDGDFTEFTSKRVENKNVHGTGCTLSSAIASFLAKGDDIVTSIKSAKDYLENCIESSIIFNHSMQQHLIDHFWKFKI